jgi:hypothetical protein
MVGSLMNIGMGLSGFGLIEVLCGHLLRESEETHEIPQPIYFCVPAKIRTEHQSSARVDRYRCNRQLGMSQS